MLADCPRNQKVVPSKSSSQMARYILSSETKTLRAPLYVGRLPEKPKSGALKVFVSEERMYLAICGHVRDVNRIFDMEFALLSVIASHRETGILQGDLVRQSGQDKRTVPKRTDCLHEKGYIDKRAVQVKGY